MLGPVAFDRRSTRRPSVECEGLWGESPFILVLPRGEIAKKRLLTKGHQPLGPLAPRAYTVVGLVTLLCNG